ncbi:hypothetical protein [Mycolicibacterium poriferae]|uniref:hypothetical protein n=1 Tax=Mycolicibacterium poriferae TaxID=39694 RepID=UPI0024B98D3D|nr:hypothetical protein [Mycolicibacterium poriferae]
MPGLAEIALAGAPIAGGALLGAAAGNIKPPDIRAIITKDLDLLDRIPAEQVERRARLQRSIDQRIDSLIDATDKSRELREAASRYTGFGGWKDVLILVTTVLFTIIWWHVDHARTNWLLMFLVLIAVSIAVLGYIVRDVRNAFARAGKTGRRG